MRRVLCIPHPHNLPEVKSKHVVLSGNLQVGECLYISASHGISWVNLLDGLTTCKGAMLIQSVGWELIWSCWKRPYLSSVRFFPWLGWGFTGILISEKLNFRRDGTLTPKCQCFSELKTRTSRTSKVSYHSCHMVLFG